MKIYPWEYTDKEGGMFKQWIAGNVSEESLKQRNPYTTTINGVKVHSLIFETAAAGEGCYARWDCINGWTTSLQQAKRNFPKGLHGKKNKFNERRKDA